MTEKQIKAESDRLHAIGQATVQRMREAHGMTHGMTHKFPTGPNAYDHEPEPWEADPPASNKWAMQTIGAIERWRAGMKRKDTGK